MAGEDFQVKEYRFTGSGLTSGVGSASPLTVALEQTNQAINGAILTVDWKSNGAGSLYLVESGIGTEIWRRNAPSGAAAWQHSNPREFGQLPTGSVTTAQQQPFMVNGPLQVKFDIGSNVAFSGTTWSMVVRYR